MFNATKHNIRPFHIHVFVNMSDCNILFITKIIKFNLKIRQSMLRAAEPKDNREFHNVNCRSCGAIHNVDRACISVLSQVIHNVNERKTVQTNMISFVSHGDKTL